MKKIIIFLMTFMGMAMSGYAQNREIRFEHGDFEKLKKKAKSENKLIFVDAYTTWCGPCKWMASEVFTNDEVADYFNANFVNLKLDMEDGGEGTAFGQKYQVFCYPNLVFIDGDGNLVHRGAGGRDAENFIAFAKEAVDPTVRFGTYQRDYEKNKTNPEFLKTYIRLLSEGCMPTDEVLSGYFSTQKSEDLLSADNWEMIRSFTQSYDSPEFGYLMKNIDKFRELYTDDVVNAKIFEILTNKGGELISGDDDPAAYNAYKETVKKAKFPNTEQFFFALDLAYFKAKGNWDEYAKLVLNQGDTYLNSETYNEVSWGLYENSNNRAALEKAAGWMQKMLTEREGEALYAEQDTYAALLYKLGKKKEAHDAAKKAIQMAKDAGMGEDDYSATTELLVKINEMK